jgi:hypothetical protein
VQVGSFENDAKQCNRLRPQFWLVIALGKSLRVKSYKCLTYQPRNSGLGCAKQQAEMKGRLRLTLQESRQCEAKSDAGASVGENPRSKAAMERRSSQEWKSENAAGREEDTGCQVCSGTCERGGLPNQTQETKRPRAGESGVGSNAGPICFAELSRQSARNSAQSKHPKLAIGRVIV